MQACTYARMQACWHAHMRIYPYARMHICWYTSMRACTYAHMLAYECGKYKKTFETLLYQGSTKRKKENIFSRQSYAHMHACTYTRMHICRHACMPVCAYADICVCTHAHMLAYGFVKRLETLLYQRFFSSIL